MESLEYINEPNFKNNSQQINTKTSSAGSYLYEWMEAIITAVITIVLIFSFIFRIVTVSGSSMENTLHDADKVMVTNFNYNPQCGDIVVIAHTKNFPEPIIKRVIATEGQTFAINFETGEVYVDGKLLSETYIKNSTTTDEGGEIPSVIPKGQVFVMGDNRQNSKDSRSPSIGLIDKSYILGKAQMVVFPVERFRSLYQ